MIVCPRYLVSLVEQGGIEDEIHSLSDQPFHMSVGQLCRITLGLAGDGLDSKLIDLAVGAGRQNHPIAQIGKEHMPEGIVLVHV